MYLNFVYVLGNKEAGELTFEQDFNGLEELPFIWDMAQS